jgi:hypothetical protein
MAALTKTKTWTKDFIDVLIGEGPSSQPGASAHDNQHRQLLFELKGALIGTNGNWTVDSSCGYASGAWSVGSSDYWLIADDVRFLEGSNYSWIVLQNNAIKTGFRTLVTIIPILKEKA